MEGTGQEEMGHETNDYEEQIVEREMIAIHDKRSCK